MAYDKNFNPARNFVENDTPSGEWIEDIFLTHFEALVEEDQRNILLDLLKLYFKGSMKLKKDIERLCREALIEKIVKT